MKTVTINCDICAVKIEGELSVFISNDVFLTPELQPIPIKKEEHFCKDCTLKIKEFLKKNDKAGNRNPLSDSGNQV